MFKHNTIKTTVNPFLRYFGNEQTHRETTAILLSPTTER